METINREYDAAYSAAQVASPQQQPPYPIEDQQIADGTRALLDETRIDTRYQRAIARFKVARDALFPDRTSGRDTMLSSQKTEREKRRHSAPLIYRNATTIVSMTVPDDHDVKFIPKKQVDPIEANGRAQKDPHLNQFAESLTLVVRDLNEESDGQDHVEAWAQDATHFGLGILKATWRRDLEHSAISSNARKDEQDNAARLKYLQEELIRGRLEDINGGFREMFDLQETLGGKQEVVLFNGMDVSNLPLFSVRIDPTIDNIEQIYQARWIDHCMPMRRCDVRSKFPYKVIEQDESGRAVKWTGVHPDHIEGVANLCTVGECGEIRPMTLDQYEQHRGSEGHRAEDDLLIVHEVWHREQGRVVTLVEGVEYPIRSHVPERLSEQWYPFIFLCPNRVPFDPWGISDTELQIPSAERINVKATSEEKARMNSIGKGFYSKSDLDAQDIKTINESRHGEYNGLNLKSGQRIGDVVAYLATPYSPEAFSRVEDYQELRQMSNISEASQAVTGRANFAAEVNAAMTGTAISTAHRQDLYRRALKRYYKLVAELALFNLSEDEVRSIAGQHAVWPKVMTDVEARRVDARLEQEAMQQAMLQEMQRAQQAFERQVQAGVPPDQAIAQIDNEAHIAAAEEASRHIKVALSEEHFGHHEPMTRESMYRRTRLRVNPSINGMVDRQMRVANAERLINLAINSGSYVDAAPLVRMAAEELRLDHEIGETQQDPNQLFQQAMRAAAANPQMVSEATMRQFLGSAQMVMDSITSQDPSARAMASRASANGQAAQGAPEGQSQQAAVASGA